MITSDQTNIDLGDVQIGTSKTFDTLVTNHYDTPLAVGVGFGCGSCTTGGFYPDNNFAPKGVRKLSIKFTPTSTGLQTKTVRLNYLPPGASTTQQVVIKFKANVI